MKNTNDKILEEFDKKFVMPNDFIPTPDEPIYDLDKRKDEIKSFLRTSIKEALESVVPEEKKTELEMPRLYQVDSTPNKFGGYSSHPFYCSLCQMSEMDIQDNKLEDGNYACHCSVWDNPMKGKWVRWYDENKAKQILSEISCEDSGFNQARKEMLNNIKEIIK